MSGDVYHSSKGALAADLYWAWARLTPGNQIPFACLPAALQDFYGDLADQLIASEVQIEELYQAVAEAHEAFEGMQAPSAGGADGSVES